MATITLNVPDKTRPSKQIERKTAQIKNLDRIKKQLDNQKDIEEFAIKLQRAHRCGRLQELKQKGILRI